MDQEIQKALTEKLVVDIETAGAAFRLKRAAAYRAKVDLGAIKMGGKWVVPTAPLRRKLGIPDFRADQSAEAA